MIEKKEMTRKWLVTSEHGREDNQGGIEKRWDADGMF